jgi:hypothetical protein
LTNLVMSLITEPYSRGPGFVPAAAGRLGLSVRVLCRPLRDVHAPRYSVRLCARHVRRLLRLLPRVAVPSAG